MNGVSHYPLGTNAFQNVPPRGTDKPLKPSRTRIKKPVALQAAISLETPAERKARQLAEATKFIHFGGINQFGITPDHMADAIRTSKINNVRVRLARDV